MLNYIIMYKYILKYINIIYISMPIIALVIDNAIPIDDYSNIVHTYYIISNYYYSNLYRYLCGYTL